MNRIIFNCDECGREVDLSKYNKEKNFLKYKKDLCRSCRTKLQYKQGLRQKCIERCKLNAASQKGKKLSEIYSEEKANDIKRKLSDAARGENNPMFGDHNHTSGLKAYNEFRQGKTWEEIHGKEKSDEMKSSMSKRQIGEKNHMYGKPSPQGSGNGWSGWYKDHYFRSLLELSFMVEHLYESAENISIPYVDFDGTSRTYHPDFIKDNVLYEIKPKNLLSSVSNKLKFEAAEKYCNDNKLIYKVVTEDDIKVLSSEDITKLHSSGEVIFIDRYEQKYQERYAR